MSKRWQIDTVEPHKTFFVYAPTSHEAGLLVRDAGLGTPAISREVGSFENGVLTIPEEEAKACAASVQYGEVKMPKGKKRS
jgi:hypothetical protein